MTYEEYQDAVMLAVFQANQEHGWSLGDAQACVGSVRSDYQSGRSVQFAAFSAMADAATDDLLGARAVS